MKEKHILRSCQLVEVIRVVTVDGDGTKENPVRESTSYFTTDGTPIGTLVNEMLSQKLDPETQILNSMLAGMNEYYASQQEGSRAEKK